MVLDFEEKKNNSNVPENVGGQFNYTSYPAYTCSLHKIYFLLKQFW